MTKGKEQFVYGFWDNRKKSHKLEYRNENWERIPMRLAIERYPALDPNADRQMVRVALKTK